MTDRVSLPAPCLSDAVYVILTSHGVCFQLAYNSRTIVELAWFHPERGDICWQTLLDKIDKKNLHTAAVDVGSRCLDSV